MERKHPIKTLFWNCNGISGKRHQLEVILEQHKPHIFALIETKLIPSISDREICDGYTLYRHDRANTAGRGGGVLIGVSDSTNIKVNNILSSHVGELLSVEIDVCGFSFVYTVYYRRPCLKNVDDFITWYSNHNNPNHFIVGDFNLPDIEWSTHTLKKRVDLHMHESFLNLVDSSDLEQKVLFPTHTKGNTLDLLLSNLETSSPLGEPTCSDHLLITCDIISDSPIPHSIQNHNNSPFWLFSKANIPDILIDCYDLDTDIENAIKKSMSIDHVWATFKSSILKTAKQNIPSHNRKPKPNPWMSKLTKREIARRRRWHNTSREHPSEYNATKAAAQSKLCDKLVNEDYNSFINSHICDKLESGDAKPLFKFIANRRSNSNTIKQLDGCIDDSPISLSECFADAFASVFTADDDNRPTIPKLTCSQTSPVTVNPKGVLKQLQMLDRKKGAGPDGLSSGLLKFLANYIYKPLSKIFQYSVDIGKVPNEWRHAHVIPVFKKGRRADPLNYRPISMTCIASKILEHIICHDVNNFLDVNNILVDCQHGFRKRHGCDTQLLTTVTDLIASYDSNTPVDLAVLDFTKAFDTVSHPKLLIKLSALGLHESTCKWISSWLSKRSLAVTVNGACSTTRPVTSGVPQGSVLGPLLFLLYINDMPNCTNFCSLRLFADDTLVYHQIQNQSDMNDLQSDLANLSDWALTWQMNFNASKCEHMRVARKSEQTVPPASYSFSGESLKSATCIKYLGVLIDETLSFDRHIQMICKKATQTLHMLMRNLKKAKCKTRSVAFKTICRPILEYASHCWSPYKKKHITSLETINRKAFRWAYYKRKHDHISALMLEVGWQTLEERRKTADLRLYFKSLSGYAAVADSAISINAPDSYSTRIGATFGVINTNVLRYSFKYRVHKYLNPPVYKFSDM